jgi:hypothetical protein
MRRITSRLSRESSEKPAVVGRVDRIRLRTRPSLNHRSALWPSPTVVCNLDYPANRVSAVAEINQKVKKKKADQTEHALTHARTVAVHLRTYAPNQPLQRFLFGRTVSRLLLPCCRSQAQQRLSWWHIRNPGHLLTCCFPNQRKFLLSPIPTTSLHTTTTPPNSNSENRREKIRKIQILSHLQ